MKIVEKWRLLTRRRRLTIYGIVTLIGSVGLAYAATTLFIHTFPAVTVPGTALVTTNCPSTTLGATTPQRGIGPSKGFVLFFCGSAGPTFTTGAIAVAVTAVGGLPAGYSNLTAFQHGLPIASGCFASSTTIPLLPSNPTPGTTLTLTASPGTTLAANQNWDYCADWINTSTSPLTLPTFTVTWQQ